MLLGYSRLPYSIPHVPGALWDASVLHGGVVRAICQPQSNHSLEVESILQRYVTASVNNHRHANKIKFEDTKSDHLYGKIWLFSINYICYKVLIAQMCFYEPHLFSYNLIAHWLNLNCNNQAQGNELEKLIIKLQLTQKFSS